MGAFGDALREERERQGYSLDDIEARTKIRKMYLQALEEDNFAVLPPRVYASGFVKNYAELLELDSAEVLARFKAAAFPGEADDTPEEARPARASRQKKKFDYKRILVALAFLVLAVWLGRSLLHYFNSNPLLEPPPPVPPVQQPVTPAEPEPEPEPEPEAAPLDHIRLDWAVSADCWVSISADGEVVLERVLRAGESGTVEAQESITGRVGNAGALALTLNNEPQPALGPAWQVAEIEYLREEVLGLPPAETSPTP